MRKKHVRIGFAALVLAVLAAGLWYSRPLTIEELCPGIQLGACTGAVADYTSYSGPGAAEETLNLPIEGDGLPPLLELLQGRKFRRPPLFLPAGRRGSHTIRAGDFKWHMGLAFEDVPVRGGTGSGFVVRLDNFFGELELSFDDKIWRVGTPDQEQWAADVLAQLQAASAGA